MFTSIEQLNLYDPDDKILLQARWKTPEGEKDKERVCALITEGAGKHFLDSELTITDDSLDLKGIDIWKLDVEFPARDNFRGIDFSYSEWWHSHWKGATFSNTAVDFSRLYNITFDKCLFGFSHWYGTRFEKVVFKNCDFVERESFRNCEFLDCKFENCFFSREIFYDCKFDVRTYISPLQKEPTSKFQVALADTNISELLKGIKDAYLSGEVYQQYRNYFFKQKQAETRHLKQGLDKILSYSNELLTGYGVKPLRPVITSLLVITTFSFFFTCLEGIPLSEALLLSMASFASVGSGDGVSNFTSFFINLEAITGIALFALFVTVLSNVAFAEK